MTKGFPQHRRFCFVCGDTGVRNLDFRPWEAMEPRSYQWGRGTRSLASDPGSLSDALCALEQDSAWLVVTCVRGCPASQICCQAEGTGHGTGSAHGLAPSTLQRAQPLLLGKSLKTSEPRLPHPSNRMPSRHSPIQHTSRGPLLWARPCSRFWR